MTYSRRYSTTIRCDANKTSIWWLGRSSLLNLKLGIDLDLRDTMVGNLKKDKEDLFEEHTLSAVRNTQNNFRESPCKLFTKHSSKPPILSNSRHN